jgi:2-polyprenyl-3-methyl-5-hydroxy-6-metoxy-1,4-benzoquinol methylase
VTVTQRDPWADVRAMTDMGGATVGPQLSYAIRERPDRLALMYARYWVASHLIGSARTVLEVGCSEGSGAGLLGQGRDRYLGIDTDKAAIGVANSTAPGLRAAFLVADVAIWDTRFRDFDAAVSLDVIEHIPQEQEEAFLGGIAEALVPSGVCVIGTPSADMEHLASPPSRVGHVNLYTADRLQALMERHFRAVIMAGMQDTSVHFGHPAARHYHLAVGFGPK